MPHVTDSHPWNERRLRVRKRALVVDGDLLSRIETRLLLEMHGYQVEEVNDGLEAIGMLDLDNPVLDLVVLDCEMPLLSGMETLYSLRALHPGLKALLCVSGKERLNLEILPEGAAFLKKPCTLHGLTEALGMVHEFTRHILGHGKVSSMHRMKIVGHPPHYPPR